MARLHYQRVLPVRMRNSERTSYNDSVRMAKLHLSTQFKTIKKSEVEAIKRQNLVQHSAILIQSAWRGYVAKLVYKEIVQIRGWGAGIIQTWWRRCITHYKFKSAVYGSIKSSIGFVLY